MNAIYFYLDLFLFYGEFLLFYYFFMHFGVFLVFSDNKKRRTKLKWKISEFVRKRKFSIQVSCGQHRLSMSPDTGSTSLKFPPYKRVEDNMGWSCPWTWTMLCPQSSLFKFQRTTWAGRVPRDFLCYVQFQQRIWYIL